MARADISYGKRLLAPLIDSIAKETPQKPYASVPVNDNDLSEGFRDITYAQIAAAVDTAAHWLEQKLGKPSIGTFPTVAYLGLRDLRYPILTLSAVKVGWKMLLPSLLTSLEAKVHMAKASHCRTFICTKETLSLVRTVQREIGDANVVVVPELEELLSVNEAPKYPYTKSWDEAKEDPFAIFHTSGSSGIPKLVTWTNETVATVDGTRLLPDIDGIPTNVPANMSTGEGSRFWVMLPLFHSAAMMLALAGPAYCSFTAVIGPVNGAPNPALADEMHLFADLDGGLYAPALLEELVSNSSYKANLFKMKNIVATGAPLSKHVGDVLAEKNIVTPMIGSTEGGWWNTIPVAPIAHLTDGRGLDDKLDWRDWAYFRFHPWSGATFEHAHADLYELVAVKTLESHWSMCFFKIPELKGMTVFRTKDLWSPHPDPAKRERGLWRYRGRTDDLVVLTGEVKMYVASAEDRLKATNPNIKAALAGGQGRKTPFLLLEVRVPETVNGDVDGVEKDYLDDVWKTVEEVNETILAETRFKQGLVLIASKEKPFVRLPKGTVDRRLTLGLYEQEIDEMYEKARLL